MRSYSFFRHPQDKVGFRDGSKGTHSSRTMMLRELESVMSAGGTGEDLRRAVLDNNLLEKSTTSGRCLTFQRLRELYGLDRATPLFRVMASLWEKEQSALPLIAILAALARDPLLRATAQPVLGLAVGSELIRDRLRIALSETVGSRFNDATLGKVVRNASSSWSQSGHLAGRTFKKRKRVEASPASMAFAVWLAQSAGFTGEQILSSGWCSVLDLDAPQLRAMLERARAAGLLDVRQAGTTIEIDTGRLSKPGIRV